MCEDLDLDVDHGTSSKKLVTMLIDDIEENGIPDPDDCSPELEDFLYRAGFTDEHGDPLDEYYEDEFEDFQEDEEYEDEEESEEPVEVEVLPQCFSFHSEKDPACRKCKVIEACKVKRLEILPECFGKAFDKNDDNCKVCIENIHCRELIK
jgi:hypothetical protein